MLQSLFKREKCVSNDQVDTCSKYASVFLTTGVPVIISFGLFFILAAVMTVIVRRKRKRTRAEEAQKNREIDDDMGDVEMVITGPRHPDQAYKHWEAKGESPDHMLQDPFEQDSRMGSRDVSPAKRY